MAKNWYPIVDEKLCIQCGKCVGLCTKNRHFAYDGEQAPRPVVIHPENCVDHVMDAVTCVRKVQLPVSEMTPTGHRRTVRNL